MFTSKTMQPATASTEISQALADQLTLVSETCTACGICVKECRFLTEYGNPRQIAESYCRQQEFLAFECSLCNLCTAVCPFEADPSRMFLEMRRETTRTNETIQKKYRNIRNYEKRGASPRFSYYGLPDGCDTVFFPGCTLPGTRPDQTVRLFEHLQKSTPGLGIILDCCTKPSHDLGDEYVFTTMFDQLKNYLLEHNIKKVIVACPNCYKVFKRYGNSLTVTSAYEELDQNFQVTKIHSDVPVTIHDPCAVRMEGSIHDAVRSLLAKTGLSVQEMAHTRENTLCCGEGGAVGFLKPDLARGWSNQRKEEAAGRPMLTYCAGCANFLNPLTPTSHLLDLLFEPEKTMAGKAKVARTPVTYLNRLRLKKYFHKNLKVEASHERIPRNLPQKRSGTTFKRLGLLVLLSSSLLGLLKGSVFPVFIAGSLAITALSALPLLYKKHRKRA